MSIFGKIKDAIFGPDGGPFGDHYLGGRKDSPKPAPAPAPQGGTPRTPAAPPATAPAPKSQSPAPTPVDPETAIADIAASKGNPDLNWRTSIVDLMKLLGLDSSLENRKALATELGYTGATDGSADMNLWLHKAVMQELAKAGGQVPGHLKD